MNAEMWIYGSRVMSGSRNQQGDGPQPPRTLAIVIACLVGAVAVAALVGLISLLR